MSTSTILIAEDELLVSHAARLEFEDAGYTIMDAAEGDEAVEVFMNNYDQIDLVLLDMTMPVMNSEILGSDAFYRPQKSKSWPSPESSSTGKSSTSTRSSKNLLVPARSSKKCVNYWDKYFVVLP